MNVTKRSLFEKKGFDLDEWKKHHQRHQNEYIRKRLRCLRAFSEGKDFDAVSSETGCCPAFVRKFVNIYLSGGFEAVVSPIKRAQPTLLSRAQEAELKDIVLRSHPTAHGLKANIWTGEVIKELIKNKFGVEYRSGVYDFLERLGLSHQKAHSDYSNADPVAQEEFVEGLATTLLAEPETTAVVFMDEFSVCEKPTSYYGWAEKNTRPTVPTNEKKQETERFPRH